MNDKTKYEFASAKEAATFWLQRNAVVLDTETTDLDDNCQIIELAICDRFGRSLFESRFRPTKEINPGAEAVHGISMSDLSEAPEWPSKTEEIQAILLRHPVLIFNADFDLRALKQTSKAFGLDSDWVDCLTPVCALKLTVDQYGATNKYGTRSLANSVIAAGAEWKGKAHSALSDCLATLDVVKAISGMVLEVYREKQLLVSRELSAAGWEYTYYSVYSEDGDELLCGHTEDESPLCEIMTDWVDESVN